MKITHSQLRRLIREATTLGGVVADFETLPKLRHTDVETLPNIEDDPEMADMSDLEVNIMELSEAITRLESARLGFREQRSPETDEISGAIDGSLSALRDALVQANKLL